MTNWTIEERRQIWNKGQVVPGEDPAVWRKDQCGAFIKWDKYGDRSDRYNNGNGFCSSNIINSAPFFISGGMIYLYRQGIKSWVKKHGMIALASCLVLTILRFVVDIKGLFILPDLIVFAAWLMYAIGSKDIVLNNRVAKYLSGISMEIYLCHMMFFRVASMLHLERSIHNNDMLYVATCIATLIGAICFSHVIKYYVFPFVGSKLSSYKK